MSNHVFKQPLFFTNVEVCVANNNKIRRVQEKSRPIIGKVSSNLSSSLQKWNSGLCVLSSVRKSSIRPPHPAYTCQSTGHIHNRWLLSPAESSRCNLGPPASPQFCPSQDHLQKHYFKTSRTQPPSEPPFSLQGDQIPDFSLQLLEGFGPFWTLCSRQNWNHRVLSPTSLPLLILPFCFHYWNCLIQMRNEEQNQE